MTCWPCSARSRRKAQSLQQDGLLGLATESAVRAFQATANLVQDGVVGTATWRALFATNDAVPVRTAEGPPRRCFDTLHAKGWSAEQSCGIVSSIARESRFNPAATGDGGLAYGLAQWHPDRQEAFRRRKGQPIVGSSLEDQLDFIDFELTSGREQQAGKRLKTARTAREAGEIVSRFYERPASAAAEAQLRGLNAETLFQGLQNAPGAPPASAEMITPPPRSVGDLLGNEQLQALLQPHRLFQDSVEWSLAENGIEASGSLAVSVGEADRDLVRKTFEAQRPTLLSVLAQGQVPIELVLAILCAAAAVGGGKRLLPGADLTNPDRTPDCVSAGQMQTTLAMARVAMGRRASPLRICKPLMWRFVPGRACSGCKPPKPGSIRPLVAAMYSAGCLRHDPSSRWRLLEYPNVSSNYIDRSFDTLTPPCRSSGRLSCHPRSAASKSCSKPLNRRTCPPRTRPAAMLRRTRSPGSDRVRSAPGSVSRWCATATGAPASSAWQKGGSVQGDTTLAPGTAIATFDPNGRYGNHTDGTSHAALYLAQNVNGIDVVDQWKSQPPHKRTLLFNRPDAAEVDRGETFFVVT